ncbi:hypothetical protein CPB84DRAFT_1783641 [Gymnopilus junonius]|uniref:Uncharacterized protein n=1 Tax=Gymnopilus junonius TaxID=109634 RepID=A0A9P5NMA1_GYMJU|nr:hypothetical protein CPB84DRAFT_1783641 [Gymnopilus junonius]
MSSVFGIALVILSTKTGLTTHSFQIELSDDPPNLPSAFNDIAALGELKLGFLSFPSFLDEEEKKAIGIALKGVQNPVLASIAPMHMHRCMDNIRTVLLSEAVIGKNKVEAPKNELAVEVGPDAASCCVLSTKSQKGIRQLDVEREFVMRDRKWDFTSSSGVEDLLKQVVNPALEALKTMPTPSQAPHYGLVVKDHSLRRITLISCAPISPFVDELILKLRESFPTVEILIPETNIAKYAADNCLAYFRSSSTPLDSQILSNTALFRVGIVKADGFVSTIIRRGTTFPLSRKAVYTTCKDNQTEAKIKVVVGVPPNAEGNIVVAELVLEGMEKRPRGVPRIGVTFDVDVTGETSIQAAVEGEEEKGIANPTASAILENLNITGGLKEVGDVEAMIDKYGDLPCDDAAEASEERWKGRDVQGDLPE